MSKPNPNSRAAQTDCCKPPRLPCEVACLHCLGTYQSSEMKWERRFGSTLWWCADPTCDGAGYGFDIHETSEPFGAGIKQQHNDRAARIAGHLARPAVVAAARAHAAFDRENFDRLRDGDLDVYLGRAAAGLSGEAVS